MEASKNPARPGPGSSGEEGLGEGWGCGEGPRGGRVGAEPQRIQDPGIFTIPWRNLAYSFFYSVLSFFFPAYKSNICLS